MTSTLTPAPEQLAELDRVVSGLTSVRAAKLRLDAEEATLLAAAASLAANIADSDEHPDGGSMAHRMIASEIGTALRESDRTVTTRMTRAHTLVTHYPATHRAVASGTINTAHATVIIEAGAIITDTDRRDRYEQAVLDIASRETAGRLRPIAKELSERYADESLDDRHSRQNACRSVRVIDLDDGMAELRALLPAPHAYGIADRLSQLTRLVKDAEFAAHTEATRATNRRSNGDETGAASGRNGDGTRAGTGGNGDRTGAGRPGFDASGTAYGSGAAQHPQFPESSHDQGEPNWSGGGDDSTRSEEFGRFTVDADGTIRDSDGLILVRRSFDQIMADLFTDLLLTADPTVVAAKRAATTDVKARIQLTTPATRVTGHLTTDDLAGFQRTGTPPVTLTGYGPIDTHSARFYASTTATWERVTTHPLTGDVLTVDTYRPSAAQRRFLAARDQHCRFPGCRVPIHRADIDHTIAAHDGGATTTENLAVLCRRHHTMKHATPWQVTQHGKGDLTWVSPTGRAHHDRPTSRVRFMPATPSDRAHEPTGAPPGMHPSAPY